MNICVLRKILNPHEREEEVLQFIYKETLKLALYNYGSVIISLDKSQQTFGDCEEGNEYCYTFILNMLDKAGYKLELLYEEEETIEYLLTWDIRHRSYQKVLKVELPKEKTEIIKLY